jgi:uncharacterized protein YqjF (DUF2071 family)
VTLQNRPGVYFFSLEAANPIAVELARTFFHLPYHNATMNCIVRGAEIEYASTRTDTRAAPAYFRARYQPTSEPFLAEKGTLEYFLTARYCAYTTDTRGAAARTEIHHPPWQLQHAECEIETNTMTEPIGLKLRGAPHLLFAKKMEMVNWLPQTVH